MVLFPVFERFEDDTLGCQCFAYAAILRIWKCSHLGGCCKLRPVAIQTISEPAHKLNAGACHDTVSGSRCRTSY